MGAREREPRTEPREALRGAPISSRRNDEVATRCIQKRVFGRVNQPHARLVVSRMQKSLEVQRFPCSLSCVDCLESQRSPT